MADPTVTERFYPFSSGPGEFVTEDDWAAMTEGFQDNGVYGHPGTTDLTIQPGPEPGTIQINPGDAQVAGFHYQLTAPKTINTVPNGGTADRQDLVVLKLDRTARTITPTLLTDTGPWAAGDGEVPLGIWTQPPSTEVTSGFWGTATDARWFKGARIRPYLPGSVPPVDIGGLIYDPYEEGSGTVFLGKYNEQGTPTWTAWYPPNAPRVEPAEASTGQDMQTWSTSFWAGTPAVYTYFVAPPSGKVIVTVSAQLEAEGYSTAYCGFEIRLNDLQGPIVRAANRDDAAAQQESRFSTSTKRKLVDGLTPGETYFIRTMVATSNSSNAASFFSRSILVEPVYTEVAPGDFDPPELPDSGGGGVSLSGGSTIRIPNGDITTQALRIELPAGDRATAPDTFGFYVNTGSDESPTWTRTSYFNEYGELRVVPSATNRVAARLRMNPGQSADAFQVTDIDNNPLGGFKANGEVFAPNVGNAKVSAGTVAPSNPAEGDLWVDLSQSPPVVNVRSSSGWISISDGDPTPDPVGEAPQFVDVETLYFNSTSITVPIPDGDFLIACLAWNSTEEMSEPLGWTKVDEIIGTNASRAAVYTAPASVSSTEWISPSNTTTKFSAVVLGYTEASVLAHAKLPEDQQDMEHTAPELNVSTVPATLVRFFWDKVSNPSQFTPDDTSATQRGVQLGTGGGAPSVLATDQEVTTAGLVPEATATTAGASAQAGGFSIALVTPA